jgi:hypothetical protein
MKKEMYFNEMELCILNNHKPLYYDRQTINQTLPIYFHKIKNRQMHFRNCLIEPLVDCNECHKFINVYISFVKNKGIKYDKNNRQFEFFKQNKKKYKNLQIEITDEFYFENLELDDFSNCWDDSLTLNS